MNVEVYENWDVYFTALAKYVEVPVLVNVSSDIWPSNQEANTGDFYFPWDFSWSVENERFERKFHAYASR